MVSRGNPCFEEEHDADIGPGRGGTLGSPTSAGDGSSASHHHRRGQRRIGRRAAGRDRRGQQPRSDRKSPLDGHRRHGTVPHRRSARGHLPGDVHPSRLQRGEAREHRASRRVRGDRQRRSARREPRGDDHGHGRVAHGGPAERARADHHGPRRADRDPLVAQRQRHPGHHPRLEQWRRFGRHHGRQRRHGRLHPRGPRVGFPDASRRHQHRMGRRQLQRRGLQRGRFAGGDRHDLRRAGRSRNGRPGAQRHPARRRQPVHRHDVLLGRERLDAGQQLHRRAACGRAAVPAGAHEGVRLQPDGRRAADPRQAVVLPHVPRSGGREHDSRDVLQQERR